MKVWSDVESGTYKETIDITLHVKGQGVAAYNIDNGLVKTYQDGTVITIGEGIAEGEVTHLRVVGKCTDLSNVAADYYYTKKENNEAIRSIYIKKPSGWGNNINIYAYDEREGSVKEVAPWPGVEMYSTEDNQYEYIFNGDWENAKVIFSNGSGAQIPGRNQTGYSLTGNHIYIDGDWN